MSWHPSRASRRTVEPPPSRYRSATVQSRAGRSMLVQLDDGNDRLLSVPAAPLPSLVGSTVLLANDYDWVVAIHPNDPVEAVAVAEGRAREVVDLTEVNDEEFEDDLREIDVARFDRRIENIRRRRHQGGGGLHRKRW